MKIPLSENCNRNFITCDANAPLITAIDKFVEINTKPFILLEDKGQFVGILSPTEIHCMQKYTKHLENLTCFQLIRTISEIFPSNFDEDVVIQRMNEYDFDYAVFIDENKNYLGLITLAQLLKRKLVVVTLGESKIKEISDQNYQNIFEDIHIISKLRDAEEKYHFRGFNDAIIYYEPIEPISILLPLEEMIDKIKKCVVKDCNKVYERIFGVKKEDIFNKQSLGSRLKNDYELKDILKYISSNNYRADNVQSHETDSAGHEKWFLNHVFFEVEDSHLVGYWAQKHEVTEQILLKQSLDTRAVVLQEQQKSAHSGNWEYNFKNKTLYISDELMNIYEIFAKPKLNPKAPLAIYDIFSTFVIPIDRERMYQAHLSVMNKASEFSSEYQIITDKRIPKHIYEHCKIIYDELNEPLLAIGTLQDITAFKQLEKSSLHIQEQFNEMFNNSADSIFIVNVLPNNDFQFERVNPACQKVIGIPQSILVSKNFSELFPNDTGLEMMNSLNRCIRENQSIHFENELTFPAGKKYYAATLVPLRCQQNKINQIIGIAIDITDKKRVEANLRRLNWALLALSKGNSAISQASSEIELIESCCESITNKNDFYPVCCVLEVTDDANHPLKIYNLSGNGKMLYHNQEIHNTELPGQDCILKSIFSKKPETQNIVEKRDYLVTDGILNSVLALPLTSHHKISFILAIYSKHTDAFKETEIRMFQELGQNIILGIEHQRTQNAYEDTKLLKEQQTLKLEHSLQNTISALGVMLEVRDPFTSGHQKRVASLAVAIAEVYGLEPQRIQWLNLAACVHDIGKITVPSEILSKPSRLTAPEFAIIKTHPEVGFQILKDIEFPGPIAEIVRQHHEYIDGSGYPFGLKGSAIMLESKILTVADIVEAMSSHRPYRPALGIEMALNELKKMKVKKLDPKAVDICVELFNKNDFKFPNVDNFNRNATLQRQDLSRS